MTVAKNRQARRAPGGATRDGDRQFVTALARGLTVLRSFSDGQSELGPAEIASRTGLPQPTVWRLCKTLTELGYLTRLRNSDKLCPGLRVLRLGRTVLDDLPILETLRPKLRQLEASFDGAVSVAGRDGLEMIFVERLQGSAFVTNARVGTRVSIFRSSLGWAFLAGLPENERNALIAAIEASDAKTWRLLEPEFSKALEHYHKRGYVICAGMLHPQINAAAVPLTIAGNEPLAVSVGGLAAHFTPELLKSVGQALGRLVSEIG
jgi:DNA-binding IclR family transcriptional regulator